MEDCVSTINDKNKKKILNIFLIVGFFILLSYYIFSAPLSNKNITIHISNGQSIKNISQELKDNNAIRSNFTLNIFVKLFKKGKGIISGDYLIKKNSPVWIVAWQISRGHHNITPIKVTIREGLDNEEIANLLADKLPGFRKDLFLANVSNMQGYLFPDTYFFFPLDTTSEIIEKLSNNFKSRINSINANIESSGKSLSDIIIMASILEGEASGKNDISIISGILWKRIALQIPLQVDVDKSTYTTKGLPSKPLNNPGMMSINAAINPTASKYLYYLHDKDGIAHYSITFEEHKRNISKYLK